MNRLLSGVLSTRWPYIIMTTPVVKSPMEWYIYKVSTWLFWSCWRCYRLWCHLTVEVSYAGAMVNKSQRFRMALEIETGTMLPSVPMESVILFERFRRPMFNYFWLLLYIVAQVLSWTYQESRGVFMFSRPRVPITSLLGWVLSRHFWFLLRIVWMTFFVLIDFEAGWKGV